MRTLSLAFAVLFALAATAAADSSEWNDFVDHSPHAQQQPAKAQAAQPKAAKPAAKQVASARKSRATAKPKAKARH